MNILLHICCAPCAIYPTHEIRRANSLCGYFYNPNIHPYSEYLRRSDSVRSWAKDAGINVIFADYGMEKYFQQVAYNEDPRNRCASCWWLRLKKTADFARENGFEAFTTTLLGSPYQDHELIKKISAELGASESLRFYYADFRKGFRKAHEEAKAKDMYLQKYCGCVFSERERIEKKCQGKNKKN